MQTIEELLKYYHSNFEIAFIEIELLANQQKKYLENKIRRQTLVREYLQTKKKSSESNIIFYAEHTKILGEKIKNYFEIIKAETLKKRFWNIRKKNTRTQPIKRKNKSANKKRKYRRRIIMEIHSTKKQKQTKKRIKKRKF